MTPNASRQLLEAARQVQVGSANSKTLGRRRLLSAMATGTMTATAIAAEASCAGAAMSASGAGAGSLLGLAASAVAVGALTGTLVMGLAGQPQSSPAARTAEPTVAVTAPQTKAVPPAAATVTEPALEPQPATSSTAAPAAPSHSLRSDRPSIEEETRLLQRAQGALSRGLYEDSLQILDEYDRRFTAARLGEEAMALRVLVHCQTAHLIDARRWASLLTERHANSALLGRLKASCPQAFVRAKPAITE